MVIKYSTKRIFNISKIVLCAALAMIGLFNINKVIAADASIVKVNGVTIYEDGSYNSSHGISGVSYNTTQKTLDLSSASLESIYANGDLTINIANNNAVDAATSQIAVEARGNLTVIGANGSSLNIAAKSADDRAIEISAGSTLTVGKPAVSDFVTLNIQRGRNVNTVDNTVIVDGNTYNYTAPGGGGGGEPIGPPAGDPLSLSIGGLVVIDETADPQVTSASGAGWNISQGFMGSYLLSIDKGVTLDYITGSGDGSLIIIGDANIAENEDGYSINMNGIVNISGGESDVAGDVSLVGGIFTKGTVNTYDRAFTIGSAESPSARGVAASEVEVSMGDLTIFTTSTALEYYNPTPAEGDGLVVRSSAGKKLDVKSSVTATNNVTTMTVSGGGKIALNYSSSLGIFSPQASHWPWVDMTGTEEENPLPITVACEEGTSLANKYKMITSEGNFLLESTAGTLYQLGWNIPGADDSVVTNGTVRVIAANGYRFTSGGYTDYSIEAGSQVTIELLPDYGYQYVSGGLNGNQTQPEEGKASYSFVMPSNHLHLSAIFEPKADTIKINDSKIKSATINMPANEINGNAELTVNDTTDVDAKGFKAAAGNLVIADYIDLSLNEVINKGTQESAWKTPITELDKPMAVNMKLDDSLQGQQDYMVLRDHNGKITKIDSQYDAKTGVLSFQTDAFSDYAIAHTKAVANPNTYDGITKYFAIGLISFAGLIGTATYLIKKKTNFNS